MLILHAVVTGAAASFVLVWWFFVELGLSFGTDPALAEQDLREIRWMIRGLIIVGIGGMFAIAAWAHLTRPQRLRWLAVIEVVLIVVGGLVIHSLM